MSPEPRTVFDTSVIVSALLFERSVPAQAFYAALGRGAILISHATLAELGEVLGRKKFDRYLTAEEREQFLAMLVQKAEVVEIGEKIHACRDPKDDKFLELAVCGMASCLVTGDEDLLVLHPFRGIPILPPAQFVESLGEEGTGETETPP